MAGLLATKMQDWILHNQDLYANEFKSNKNGALRFYAGQSGYGGVSAPAGAPVTREIAEKALRSTGNTIKFPVLKRNTSGTVGTSRSCSATNNEIESALVGLDFMVAQYSFVHIPNRYANNMILEDEHFNAKMLDTVSKLANKLDTYCLNDLDTNKTQVLKDDMGYTVTSDVVEASGDDRFDLLADIESMMISNNYDGHLNIIGSTGMQNLYAKLGQHATYNDVNKRIEIGDKTLYLDNNLAHTGKFASFYAVEDAQVGLVGRVSLEQARNQSAGDYEWFTMTLPGLYGLPVGVTRKLITGNMNTSYGDGTMAHLDCSFGYEYIFTVEIAFLDKYNSAVANYPNPIIKANIGNFVRGVNKVELTGAGTASTAPLYTQSVTPSAE